MAVQSIMAASLTGCCLQQYFDGQCGVYKKFPLELNEIHLKDCSRSVVGHLRSCNISEKAVSTEGELIALRAGIWRYNSCVDKGITVCPFHRYTYGICWKPPQRCGFPGHSPQSKSKPQRGMTARMCEIAQLGWGKLCRIGTGKIKNRDFM